MAETKVTKAILIGENHYDLEKPQRYARAFERFQPDTVSIEGEKGIIETASELLNLHLRDLNQERRQAGLGPLRPANCRAIESLEGSYFSAAAIWQRRTGGKIVYADQYLDDIDKEMQKRDEPISEEGWQKIKADPSLEVRTFIAGLGEKAIERQFRKAKSMDDAFYGAMIECASNGNREQLRRFQCYQDCQYTGNSLSLHSGRTNDEEFSVAKFAERDEAAAKTILSKGKGVVVHCGGFHHVFGNHHNLFDRLSPHVEVERYLLFDFSHDDPEVHRGYVEELTQLARSLVAGPEQKQGGQ